MKIYLPVYTTAVGSLLLGDLQENYVDHQQALDDAMLAHCYNSNNLVGLCADAMLSKHPKKLKENAIAHVKKIVEIMDIRDYDYAQQQDMFETWFDKAMWWNGREYVLIKNKWYERTWKKSVIKAPLKKQGLVFLKDWTSKHPTAGLTILTDKKNLRTLTYGMAVEKQSKQIVHAADLHLKNLRADKTPDATTVRKRGEHFKVIEDQFIRDRGLKVNEAVKEILKEARTLLFCGPITAHDKRYYAKNGIDEI
jgi:3-phosphoglycerate kinase